VQTCMRPSWCHCHSLSLASVKSRLVLPFSYRLTRVVPEKGPLNGCVCVMPVTRDQCMQWMDNRVATRPGLRKWKGGNSNGSGWPFVSYSCPLPVKKSPRVISWCMSLYHKWRGPNQAKQIRLKTIAAHLMGKQSHYDFDLCVCTSVPGDVFSDHCAVKFSRYCCSARVSL